jgi:ribA/ribD-fused uncharacterized protein
MAETFTFFWDGPFSQWYPADFTEGGITYNCAEQYMMAKKATLFGDLETLKKIMEAPHPRQQKALGREVTGFNTAIWERVARAIVYQGNFHKFTQNPDLYAIMMETVGTTIVEASPVDRIWGIGLAEDNPLAYDRASWKGRNWLGIALTDLREDLLARDKAA